MNPLLIVVIAPLAIAGLIFLVYLLGGTKRAQLNSESDALARFQKDYPEWAGTDVRLSADKHMALLPSTTTSDVGLLFAVGDTFVARILKPADIELPEDTTAPARVHFHDFTAPDIEVPRALLAA